MVLNLLKFNKITCQNHLSTSENTIATYKRGYPHNIFHLSRQKHMFFIRRGTSKEYPQHMFLLGNKKDINIFG